VLNEWCLKRLKTMQNFLRARRGAATLSPSLP
jgi:hypothetical protein